MKKKILAMTLALTTVTVSAFAENEKAAEYRQILDSGKFYVEYELDYGKKCLAVQDGKRMDYTVFSKSGNAALGVGLSLINPFLALASLFVKSEDKNPSHLYQDGKYYQFPEKKRAIMATWDQLKDPNLKPEENWDGIKYRLALPEEFSALSVNDPFYQELYGGVRPTFLESGSTSIDGKDYDYDRYQVSSYSASGSVLFNKYYYLYYLNGELKRMQSYMGHSMEDETLIRTIEIKKLTGELPANVLKIPNGCKVYAAGIGDMNDLIDQPVLVESYEQKEKSEDAQKGNDEE